MQPGQRGNTTRRDKNRAIIARTRPPCHVCGGEIDWDAKYPDPQCFTADHVIPIAAGGTDTLENLRAAHRSCNASKNAKPHAAGIVRRSGALR